MIFLASVHFLPNPSLYFGLQYSFDLPTMVSTVVNFMDRSIYLYRISYTLFVVISLWYFWPPFTFFSIQVCRRGLSMFFSSIGLDQLTSSLLPHLIKEVSSSQCCQTTSLLKLHSKAAKDEFQICFVIKSKSLSECSFNTNELTEQKEAKRIWESIRLDSKVPLLRVLAMGGKKGRSNSDTVYL